MRNTEVLQGRSRDLAWLPRVSGSLEISWAGAAVLISPAWAPGALEMTCARAVVFDGFTARADAAGLPKAPRARLHSIPVMGTTEVSPEYAEFGGLLTRTNTVPRARCEEPAH
jgi:hypothetical protein